MKKKIRPTLEIFISKDKTSCNCCPFEFSLLRKSYCRVYNEELDDNEGQTMPMRAWQCLRDQIVAKEDN